MEIAKLILQIIQTLAVITASGIAVNGINKWRREAIWKRKFDVAEESLALFYQCRENLRIIRFSGSMNEAGSRPRDPNETPAQSASRDAAYVVHERYKKMEEPFSNLFALKFRFRVLFGSGSEKPFEDLRKILNEIFFANYKLHDPREDFVPLSPDEAKRRVKQNEKHEATLWRKNPIDINADIDTDDVDKRVTDCINRVEQYSRTIPNFFVPQTIPTAKKLES